MMPFSEAAILVEIQMLHAFAVVVIIIIFINHHHRLCSLSECNCHRHSFDCFYDAEVDRSRASLDMHGHFRGGGVCLNCQVRLLNAKQCVASDCAHRKMEFKNKGSKLIHYQKQKKDMLTYDLCSPLNSPLPTLSAPHHRRQLRTLHPHLLPFARPRPGIATGLLP